MIENAFEFDQELHRMNEDELRMLLRVLYLRADRAVSQEVDTGRTDAFAAKVQSIFKELDKQRSRDQAEKQALETQKTREIHIAFGDSPLGSIKVAMGNVPGRTERRFFTMNDYYAIGPLGDLTNKVNVQRRHLWLFERFHMSEHGRYAAQGLDELLHINQVVSSIEEETRITIWYANNGHERTGLLYTMHLLRDRKGPIYLIETRDLYPKLFNTPEVQYEVCGTGEIHSENLLKMWHHCEHDEALSSEERRLMEQEWLHLSAQPGHLRLMQDGYIQSVSEDAIDEFIMQKVREVASTRQPGEFIKSSRIVGEVLGHLEQAVGDTFIEYRIRQLILQGRLDMEGMPHAMRFYSVRLASS
ncbi:DUF1835 domain-containing protein [Paenibacillus sp. DCT19]|uniref:DUF1835 domain-containing protein n=1 Tax=Paenibacillus sp. DCT19 TaxID=2211212 RepID=UPI000FE193EF|nr:DUF1835 domain-containing protein [Paenibacillus sp. DCT19]